MTRRRVGRLFADGAVLIVGLTLGLLTLRLALLAPGWPSREESQLGVVLGLAAGWSLIAVGLMSRRREPANQKGALLVLAGLAWFVSQLANPAIGSAVLFTVGLLMTAACPPLVAHAALAYPDGRLAGAPDRIAIAAAYVSGFFWSGVVATLTYDPGAALCAFCPANYLSIGADAATHVIVTRVGLVALTAWGSAVVILAIRRIALASSIKRVLIGPVVVPGAVFVGVSALGVVTRLAGATAASEVGFGLAILETISLVAMSMGVAWPRLRARRTRTSMARLVVELGSSGVGGNARDVLARELADPDLEVAYPLADGRSIGRDGLEVDVRPAPGHAVTPLVRGQDVVAVLRHRPELLDDPQQIDNVVAALRLTIEGERLGAELQARLEDLRASRVRIVEAADAERRRLERDLHDGAQQRLVGLAIALRMLDRELEVRGNETAHRLVTEATEELRTGIAELRDLAHGIYPAALSGEGLAAALEALQEASPITLDVAKLPTERLDPRVEATAYFIVAETLRVTPADKMQVAADREGDRLIVEIVQDGAAPDNLMALRDRVGALDGTIDVHATRSSHAIRVEIPCAS
jgi:signal transduction histidine kinase